MGNEQAGHDDEVDVPVEAIQIIDPEVVTSERHTQAQFSILAKYV